MVVRRGYVYWLRLAERGGTLERVRLDGGPVETIASGLGRPAALAVGDTHAYVTEPDAGRIEKIALDGGARQVIFTGHRPLDVALDRGFVYWTDFVAGTVERMPRRGGPVQVIAPNEGHPSHLALDDTFIYWTTRGEGNSDGTVMRACKDGRFPRYLALGENKPSVIRVQDGVAFWIDFTQWEMGSPSSFMEPAFMIRRSTGTPASPGKPTDLTDAGSDRALAVDGSRVFFATGWLGCVGLGGGATRLVSRNYLDGAVALDACNVYFATHADDLRVDIVKRWKASPTKPAPDEGYQY